MAPLRRLDGWDISVRKCRVSNDTICIAATTSSGVSRDSSTKGKGEYEYIYIKKVEVTKEHHRSPRAILMIHPHLYVLGLGAGRGQPC